MTKLIVSIRASTLDELRVCIAEAIRAGAGHVELRLDYLDPATPPSAVGQLLAALAPDSWIATLRSVGEGGECDTPSEVRAAHMREAVTGLAGWTDFEARDWSEPVAAHLSESSSYRLILSAHDFDGRISDPAQLVREMLDSTPASVGKVAWRGAKLDDNIAAFELMHEFGERVIAVVMGEVGIASRVLAKKFGAAGTYCAPGESAETAPGQLTMHQMLGKYRWDSLSPSTRWFGVLGAPVRHSLSPTLFNRLFDQRGIDAVYLPLLASAGDAEVHAFLEQCERRSWLDVGGFSVTLPHKHSARRFVGSRIEPLADRIGAINTLVLRGRQFFGYNTDYAGALGALCGALRCEQSDLAGMRVDVLGAGGAARAVVAGLVDCGCAVTLFNRTAKAAVMLAGEFECEAVPWEQRIRRNGAVVINCTSLGMSPHIDASPLPAHGFDGQPLVFDTVYNPAETTLLRDAAAAGCATVSGVEMFVRQAAAQYALWFGEAADVDAMRAIVREEVIRVCR